MAVIATVAGLCLAGCTSGSGSTSGGTPTTGAGSAPQGSGGSNDLFPAVVGNTWVYHEQITGFGSGTTTSKIISVVPVAAGKRVTVTARSHIPKVPSTPSTLIYVLHPDGSITVPLAQVGNGRAAIKSGSIVWPSKAVLDSGKPHTRTLVLGVTAAGRTLTVKARVTVKGGGTQSVTVPAGTYTATLVDQFIAERVQGVAVTILLKTWLAHGIGPVKEVAFTMTGDVSQLVSTEVLTSFTKG